MRLNASVDFFEGLSSAGIYKLVRRHGDFLIQSGFAAMKIHSGGAQTGRRVLR